MKQMLTVVSPRLPVPIGRHRPTPIAVQRDDVLDLLGRGAQLVEVLSPAHYAEAHLPGAVNIPLDTLDPHTTAQLDPQRPVIVYCADDESDLSSRAAWRLLSLGFGPVYRYTRGKADWLANGLPIEGTANTATAASLARPDVPTCRLHDQLAQLSPLLQDDRWEACVVVNDERVVLGRLSRRSLAGDPRATAEQVMEPGPPTVRANAELRPLARALAEAGQSSVLVTTTAGQLVGLLRRADIEHYLETAAASPGG